jgi:hypothetical protein
MSPVAETNQLTDLFLLLGDDPSLLAEYERDPRGLLEESGLDMDAVETLLTGDPDAVRGAVEAEVATDPSRRRLVVGPRMMLQVKPMPEEEGGDEDEDEGQDDDDDRERGPKPEEERE